MIDALIAVDRDAGRMADLAQRRMRVKIPQLIEALVGRDQLEEQGREPRESTVCGWG